MMFHKTSVFATSLTLTRPLTLALVLAMLTVPGCGGAGDQGEAVFDDIMDTMNEFAELFGAIEDEESANAAAARIESHFVPHMEQLGARMQALEESLGNEAIEEIAERYQERGAEVSQRLMGQMMRVMMDNELRTDALQEAMAKFEEVGSGLQL